MANLPHHIPLLPGLPRSIPVRTSFHRPQIFGNPRAEAHIGLQPDWLVREYAAEREQIISPYINIESEGLSERPSLNVQLQNLAISQPVLRFFGFFPVKSVENGEAPDLRRVAVYFFLGDQTIQLSEPRVENSGYQQGVLLRRGTVFRSDGNALGPLDFVVGHTVRLYAFDITITDCDQSTRKYYADVLGFTQPRALEIPLINGQERLNGKISQQAHKVKADHELHISRKAPDIRKFLADEGKVLKFRARWADANYVLSYHLYNGTVEIRQQPDRATAEPFQTLLRRQRVPKPQSQTEFIAPLDLQCGKSVDVFGRKFDLFDCDEYTKRYYLENFHIEQIPYNPEPPKPQTVMPIPPPIGFGSDEDSIGSVYSLHPKPPAFDLHRFEVLDGKTLRFRAKLKDATSTQDELRNFILTYYFVDFTVSVFEPRAKNSADLGGKFLDRGRHRYANPPDGLGSRYFKPGDFYVGAEIAFEFSPRQRFILLEADEQTLKLCEAVSSEFPFSDRVVVVEYLMLQAVKRRLPFRSTLSLSAKGCLTMTMDAFLSLFKTQEFGFLNPQQVLTLARAYFDPVEQGIRYHDLCDDVCRKFVAKQKTSVDMSFEELEDIDNDASFALAVLRTCPINLRAVFRRAIANTSKKIQISDLVNIVEGCKLSLSRECLCSLWVYLDKRQAGTLDYDVLCSAIYKCDFDDLVEKHVDSNSPTKRRSSKVLSPPHPRSPVQANTARSYPKGQDSVTKPGQAPEIRPSRPLSSKSILTGGAQASSRVGAQTIASELPPGEIYPTPLSVAITPAKAVPSSVQKLNMEGVTSIGGQAILEDGIFQPSGSLVPEHVSVGRASRSVGPSPAAYETNGVLSPSSNDLALSVNPSPVQSHVSQRSAQTTTPNAPKPQNSNIEGLWPSKSNTPVLKVVQAIASNFEGRKYQLRTMLRAQDTEGSGLLDEDRFVKALLTTNPNISDEDIFVLADYFFHEVGAKISYQTFLDVLFS